MIKVMFSSGAVLLISLTAFSQPCNLALKDGGKMITTVTTYTNLLPYDPKFTKEKKQEKKDAMIGAFNADVLSGKVAAATTSEATSVLSKATVAGTDKYKITTVMGKYTFNYYLDCRNDTIFTYLHSGSVPIGFDTLNPDGYRIEGPMVLPMNVKTGDVIPSYDDITIGFPAAMDKKVKHRLFLGSHTSGNHIYSHYKTIDVKVRQTLTYSGHIIHHVNALITGEEEFTISGKKYSAYIVESEGWTKATIIADYETANAQVKKEQYAFAKKMGTEGFVPKGWTNELGYVVSNMKEWYVPQIGIVKYEAYDLNGAIFMISTVTGLE